jgi:ABC-type spermidine/putrescine transport system permease subunit II
MSSRNALHLQLSLMQAIKLVAYCAAAFAFVAPLLRQWKTDDSPWSGMSVFIVSAVAVPLIWVSLSFLLVRRGLWSDRLIFSLLLCSVSVALAADIWMVYVRRQRNDSQSCRSANR